MSNQKAPDGSSEWEQRIAKEANNFIEAIQQNFQYGLKLTRGFLPKQDPYHLRAQLGIFIDAMTAVFVQTVCSFINPTEEVEENVIAAVREKFQLTREVVKAEAERKKLGLVDTQGKPLTGEPPQLVT